ncbi:MAG: hypothetical protein ACE5KE_00770 [Methanosarcinales archaeon]
MREDIKKSFVGRHPYLTAIIVFFIIGSLFFPLEETQERELPTEEEYKEFVEMLGLKESGRIDVGIKIRKGFWITHVGLSWGYYSTKRDYNWRTRLYEIYLFKKFHWYFDYMYIYLVILLTWASVCIWRLKRYFDDYEMIGFLLSTIFALAFPIGVIQIVSSVRFWDFSQPHFWFSLSKFFMGGIALLFYTTRTLKVLKIMGVVK